MATKAGRYDEMLTRVTGKSAALFAMNADTVEVAVFNSDGVTAATLYDDRDKTAYSGTGSIVTPDSAGNIEFFADPGIYVLSIRSSGTELRRDTVNVSVDGVEAGALASVTSNETVSGAWDFTGGISENGTALSGTYIQWENVVKHGAVGDGVTDDTAAIQAAIDAIEAANGGVVYLPVGSYLVSSTLEYVGTSATTITFMGAGRAGRGPRGAVVKWDGAAGGTTLRLRGGQNMVVSGLAFTAGVNAPLYDVDFVSNQPAGGSGLANVRVEDCHFGGASGTDSAFVRIGDSNFQADTVLVASCTLSGNEVQPTYGVLTAAANAKNFSVRNTEIIGCQTGIHHGGAGYLTVDSCGFSSNQVADIRAGAGQVSIRGCGSEGSVRFITGTTGTNHGSVSVLNSYFDSDLVPLDDYVITYEGALFLAGCALNNRRTASAVAKVKGGGLAGASSSSIVSIGNFYLNATGSAPLYDGSGNQWKTRLEASTGTALHVMSFSDLGGSPGALAGLTAGWADDMVINDLSAANITVDDVTTGLVGAPASTTFYLRGAASAGFPLRIEVANGAGTLTRRFEVHGSGTQLKDAAAATMVDIAASKLGFFGTAAAAQPSLTYSRTGETTPEAQLRAALAALGLVADNTTA